MIDEKQELKVRPLNATCPHCRGPLSEVTEDDVVDYRCLVDHRFSQLTLLSAHAETQQRTLWGAVVVLEEAAIMAREVAAHRPTAAESLLRHAEEKQRQANFIRGVLEQLTGPASMEE